MADILPNVRCGHPSPEPALSLDGYWGKGALDVLSSPEDERIAIVHIQKASAGKKYRLSQTHIDSLARPHRDSKSDFYLTLKTRWRTTLSAKV